MKFKEIKPGMVIHCPTEEDARALLEYLHEMGMCYNVQDECWKWISKDTCYGIHSHGDAYRTNRGFLMPDTEITEFSDLIEPETLSGKEVIEWLDKYSREIESMPELFPNCKTITDVVEWYTPECIMEKMVWYEKHKKDNADSPINSPINLPMTAEELMQWLMEHYRDGSFKDVFGSDYSFDGLIDEYEDNAGEVIQKIIAYEAEKKAPKPVEVEEGWRILVYDNNNERWSGDYFYLGYTREEVESIAKRVAIDCVRQTGESASWCVINACRVKE